MNAKKILSLVLVMVLMLSVAFTFAACTTPETPDSGDPGNNPGGNDNPGGNPGGTTPDPETPSTVDYTVYVKDTAGNPIAGAFVQLCTDAGCRLPQETDTTGKAVFTYAPDNFKAQLSAVPTGFIGSTDVKYTMANNAVVITLEPAATYTVSVKDTEGNAVAGAVVHHAGVLAPVTTGVSGLATFECAAKDNYKVFVIAPEGYAACTEVYVYQNGTKSINVILTPLQ